MVFDNAWNFLKSEVFTKGPRSRNVPEGYREAAGVIITHPRTGRILFVRRSPKETSKHGMWELPGGKVEGDEHPESTAAIEAMEEVGLPLNYLQHAGSHVDHDKNKVYHGYKAILHPRLHPDEHVKLSEEHDEHRWVHPDDVPSLLDDGGLSHHAEYLLGPDNPGGDGGTAFNDFSTHTDSHMPSHRAPEYDYSEM